MKFGSIRYLIREGFRNIWQNRFMSLASVFVLIACLMLSGAAYMVAVNVEQTFRWVYGQNVVVVYADAACEKYEIDALEERLRALDNVASVEYLSGADALERYAGEFSEDLLEQMREDPDFLQDSFILSFADVRDFEATVEKIQRMQHVDTVEYSGGIAETLARIRSAVLGAGIWIILLLLAVSLFIIVNTIKLTVHNRRLEIHIMKSVGATDRFIRVPFVVEGMTLGLVAGLLSFLTLWFAYGRVVAGFSAAALGAGPVPFGEMAGVLILGCLLAGALTGAVGSAIAIRRYLRAEPGDRAPRASRKKKKKGARR